MNRQEAITVMRDTNWSRMMVDWSYTDRRRVLDAIMASLAALRGPEPDPDTGNVGKRVQGCWYCNDDVMQIADSPNKPPINATYCGLCGRKLKVEG